MNTRVLALPLAIAALLLAVVQSAAASPVAQKEEAEAARHRKAADEGDANAALELARMYEWGVAKNAEEAARWYRKAAELGNPVGAYCLATKYQWGHGVPQDGAQAVFWFEKSDALGNLSAAYALALMYDYGADVQEDQAKATHWYRKAAEAAYHSPDIEYELAMRYLVGRGVQKNQAEAAAWMRKAAEEGFARAELGLGLMYHEGRGVDQDLGVAAEWIRKAAEHGDVNAQYELGRRYTLGWGIPKNEAEAVRWFRQPAEQGNELAQAALGVFYDEGTAIREDKKEAARWYQMAAEQGNVSAQARLGEFCQLGVGVPKSSKEALRWYRRAAEQGHADSQCRLGLLYAYGEGVPQNYFEAYKWLNLSVSNEETTPDIREEARKARLALARHLMTSTQIGEAQRASAEFVVKLEQSERKNGKTGTTKPMPFERGLTGTGTAFAITNNGYLLTNLHVVAKAARVQVLAAGKTLPVRVVKTDPAYDIALLKAEGKYPALALASSKSTTLGQTVFTIGFPNVQVQGSEPKLTRGEISSLSGIQDDIRYFQISVPLQPGNSGGPLADLKGNVVGITSAALDEAATLEVTGRRPQNVNYAVKSEYLLDFLKTVPELASALSPARQHGEPKFEDVVSEVKSGTMLLLTY